MMMTNMGTKVLVVAHTNFHRRQSRPHIARDRQRSRRDRLEIAPKSQRSRRDRGQIARRSRADFTSAYGDMEARNAYRLAHRD